MFDKYSDTFAKYTNNYYEVLERGQALQKEFDDVLKYKGKLGNVAMDEQLGAKILHMESERDREERTDEYVTQLRDFVSTDLQIGVKRIEFDFCKQILMTLDDQLTKANIVRASNVPTARVLVNEMKLF